MREVTEPAAAATRTWGLDSEYGRLRDVLLASPENFTWIPRSPAEKARLERAGGFRAERARNQHQELVDALVDADVTCHFLEPDPVLPYQVFTRDSSSMTPWGALIAQINLPPRRGEYAPVIDFYLKTGIPIWKMPTAGCVEGADVMVIWPGLVLIGCTGARTEEPAARQVAQWVEEQGWEATIVPFPEQFIHIDALVCMVPGSAAAVSEAAPDEVLMLLEARGVEIFPVTYRDTMKLGCNVIALGDDRVVSTVENVELNSRLRSAGFDVYEVDYAMFTTHFGGLHCSTMALRRDTA